MAASGLFSNGLIDFPKFIKLVYWFNQRSEIAPGSRSTTALKSFTHIGQPIF